MLSREELNKRRSIINEGATFKYITEFPQGYHNRAMRRQTAHTVHRSKWSKWHSGLGKTVCMLPKHRYTKMSE